MAPWFTGWVVLSTAFSLAAVASVFSIADRLLLRPPAGIGNARQIGRISARSASLASGASFDQLTFSYPAYQSAKERAGPRLELAAFTDPGPGTFAFGDVAADARVSLASGNYFHTLSVRAAAGALFRGEDDDPSAAPVAVLSEAFARRLGPAVQALLGKSIRVDGRPYTIIGIAGGAFTGTEIWPTDVWLPLRAAGEQAFGERWTTNPAVYPLAIVGRRSEGLTSAIASQIALSGLAAEPPLDGRSLRYLTARFDRLLQSQGPNPSRHSMLVVWLAATALAMLLVASINVGTLYLARGRRESRNLAVRMALGATRARIVRGLVGEALVLTAAGTALGLLVAQWTAGMLRALILPDAAWSGRLVDLRIAAGVALLALVVALGTSVLPSLRSSAIDPAVCVRDAPAASTGGGRRWRFVLHCVQAALSAALLFATGLFLRSSLLAQRLDLGFEPKGLYAVTGEYPSGSVSPAVVEAAFMQLRERLAAARGVVGVTVASSAPMVSSGVSLVYADGAEDDAAGSLEGPFLTAVDDDYLAVTGTRLLRGTGLGAGPAGGALVGRSTAARLWPGRDPIGRCLRLGAQDASCTPVVGVTEDAVRRGITDPPGFQVYVPLAARPGGQRLLLVRFDGAPDAGSMLRPLLAEAFPASIIPRVRSLERVTASQSALWRTGATLFSLLGAIMIFLAALGLYGSLSYLVSMRRYEFGVRIALGEPPYRIAVSFVRFGLMVTGAGVLAGIALLWAGRSFLQPLLFETSVFDADVIVTASLVLGLVSLAATGPAALAAARTDPITLLRGYGT